MRKHATPLVIGKDEIKRKTLLENSHAPPSENGNSGSHGENTLPLPHCDPAVPLLDIFHNVCTCAPDVEQSVLCGIVYHSEKLEMPHMPVIHRGDRLFMLTCGIKVIKTEVTITLRNMGE